MPLGPKNIRLVFQFTEIKFVNVTNRIRMHRALTSVVTAIDGNVNVPVE